MTSINASRGGIVRFALLFAVLALVPPGARAAGEAANDGYTSVMIHADRAGVRAIEREIAAITGRAGRRLLVPRYRETVLAELDALVGELRPLVEAGSVRNVRPLWIAGAVVADVRAEAVDGIALLPGVDCVVSTDRAAANAAAGPAARNGRGGLYAPMADDTSWALGRLGVTGLWAAGLTGEGVVVAILDTGVDETHPDLSGRLWTNPGEIPGNGLDDDGNWYVDDVHGYDFAGRTEEIADFDGHGTRVAGCVAGDGTAGSATGAAPGSRIMICKAFEDLSAIDDMDCFEAIQYAVENGADVINMSFGVAAADRRGWRETCRAASLLGTTIVAEAGDGRGDLSAPVPANIPTPGDVPSPTAPGNESGVITIGAVTKSDAIWDPAPDTLGSGEGPVSWETVSPYLDHPYPPGLVKPDLAAPGDSLRTTAPGGGYVDDVSGTSYAAPLTAGVAALLLQQDPNLLPARLDSILQATAIDLGAPGKDSDFGAGLVDAAAASAVLEQNVASGHITENTTWYSGIVYLVTGDLTIDPGVTLAIEAGVIVKVGAGASIVVEGVLFPQGTSTVPVVFTSWRDDAVGGDTNGDGPSAGEAGDWGQVRIVGTGNVIQFCEFYFGGSTDDVDAVLYVAGGDPVIRYCRIESGYEYGDWIYCEGGSPIVEHNRIVAEGLSPTKHVTAIHATGGSPRIRFNRIEFTGTFAFVRGIQLDDVSSGAVALGNRIDDTCLWNGGSDFIIRCAGSTAPEISADTIATLYGNGIGCSLGTAATLSANVVSGGGAGRGIYCHESANVVVTGNKVSSFAYGIESYRCRPTITSNTISHTATVGERYPFVHVGSAWPSYASNTVSGTCMHAIGVKGVTDGNLAWNDIEGRGWPYVLIDNFIVNAGDTLAVPAGLVIKVSLDRIFYLNGLLALGATAADPVIFTSWRDDTAGGDSNGDGPSAGVPGDWGYLRIANGDNLIEHCEFRYGGNTAYYDDYAIYVASCDPVIRRCSILECKDNNVYGIYCEYAAPTIEDCTIRTTPVVSANATAIYCVYSAGQPMFTGNTISGFRVGVLVNGIGTTGTQPRVTGNSFDGTGTDATGYGVYCIGAAGAIWHPYIEGNELIGNCTGWGVYLNNVGDGTIVQNNDIFDFSLGGVRGAGASGWITSNSIAQGTGYVGMGTGIEANAASDLIITGNMINGFATGVHSASTSTAASSDLTIRNNHILNAAGDGLRFESLDTLAWDGPTVVVENNDIWGHGGYNLSLGHYQSPASRHIAATGNWWGTANADTVAMGIFDYTDNVLSPVCDYEPYLTEPIEDDVPNLWVFPARLHVAMFPNEAKSTTFMLGNSGVRDLTFAITEGIGETAAEIRQTPVPGSGREPVTLFDVPWIFETPTDGTILGGQQEEIEVFFSSTGLTDSIYTSYLILDTNDPDMSTFVMPATMEVSHVFVTGPNGGESYQEKNDINVTWTTAYSGDVEEIDILFSSDNGQHFYPVVAGEPNDGSFSWRIPGLSSDSCRVMVIAHYPSDRAYFDVSDSVFSIIAPVDAGEIPGIRRAALRQNFPNPFNPSTTITFALPERTRVRLDVYAPDGRHVATLVDGERDAGIHTVMWDGVNGRGAPVSSGIFFCRMRAGGRTETRKLILVR
ncbi:MAG: S8 family serine peptidase [Candidatus Krumholzibacteriota bacterium]|nr:S8 family serine peptidase [Candidatus Krumholzibacteriota bacterium]